MDKSDQTMDFLLTADGNRAAALRFLKKASGPNGVPSLINIDKSGASTLGINASNAALCTDEAAIELRQCKDLNNIVEQDHRFIKERVRAILELRTSTSAGVVLGGIAVIHMIRKNQLAPSELGTPNTAAE